MNHETVFVYGTLRSGGSNHFRMQDAIPLGPAIARGHLYRVDWYPALLLDPDGDIVHGEIYQISSGTLSALDEFEGAAYRRVQISVTHTAGENPIDAWVWEYLETVDESRRIPNGDWLTLSLDD